MCHLGMERMMMMKEFFTLVFVSFVTLTAIDGYSIVNVLTVYLNNERMSLFAVSARAHAESVGSDLTVQLLLPLPCLCYHSCRS